MRIGIVTVVRCCLEMNDGWTANSHPHTNRKGGNSRLET